MLTVTSPKLARMSDSPLTSGIHVDELEPSIRPQDDLFRHVNSRWIERTEIPSDKARYGSFYLLAEEAEKAVRDIIMESQSADPGTEARKVGDLYASFMDEGRIQALGAAPLEDALADVARVDSIPSLLETLGRLERGGSTGMFQIFVDNDPGQPERYLVFLEQGGIGLPDESYFREEKFAEIREKYVAFLVPLASSPSRPSWPVTTGTTSRVATARRRTTPWRGTPPTRSWARSTWTSG
jgi:putative endopeptidase